MENQHYAKAPWYTQFFRSGHLLVLSTVILLVMGFSAVSTLPRLEDPRIDNRNVIVLTPYPGASAERVEALVSDVIEDELRQLYEIKEIKSTSRAGISVVSIELQAWVDNTTNEEIFSKIRDRLADAQRVFPDGAGTPDLDDQRGATAFTMLVGLQPKPGEQSSMLLSSRLSEELADRLRNVPGTEIVRTYGDLDEEITVTVTPEQLASAGISLQQASQLVSGADPKLPAGVLRGQRHDLRMQVAEELDGLQRIRDIPLNTAGQGDFLRLGDIADVQRDWRVPEQDIAMVNGQRAVFVAARMQTTVRVDKWMQSAQAVVSAFDADYNGSIQTQVLFDQNEYTEARLSGLTQNLLLGCLVVMLVVLAFMGVRSALIVGLALPLSAAFALFSLSFFDEQIHQMSIFGILIAIGLLIDNAIVITDEIRVNLLDRNHSRLYALNKSLRHLFSPLLASTLTTILGFMPIFLLPGNIGDFVGPIAISVVMALIGSLLISLTIIAGLAARLLPRPREGDRLRWHQQGVQMPKATQWFRCFLASAIEKPAKGLIFVVAFAISGFILAGQLGNVFFPSADRDQFQIYLWMPSGTSIGHTQTVVQQVDADIRSNDTVQQVTWLIGGSTPSVYYNQVMNKDNTPHYANAVVTATGIEQAATLIETLQRDLDKAYPQAKIVVRAFGQGPPISAPVGVDIYGSDTYQLYRLGEKVRLAMAETPGVTQTIASIGMGEPELVMDTTRDESRLASLNLTDVASQLQVALEGQVGGSVLQGTEEIPVRVRVSDSQRSSLDNLASLPLINPALAQSQQWMPLSALGDFSLQPTITGITRTDGQRVNKIEGFLLPGATAIDVSTAIAARLAEMDFDLPPGYRIKMAGDADEQNEAVGQLATYVPVLLVLMVTTLILTFNSVRYASIIGAVAILSVGMGMLSLWISGLPVGFNPILGSAGLIGVAINGSIVVIAAINANEKARLGDTHEIVTETMSCSRHILSTTVTTVGGFVPLLLFSEGTFWPPLAVVLAGGVGFSVLLSLLFTPLVMGLIGRYKGRKAEAETLEPVLQS